MRFVGFLDCVENTLFTTFQGRLYFGGSDDQYVIAMHYTRYSLLLSTNYA